MSILHSIYSWLFSRPQLSVTTEHPRSPEWPTVRKHFLESHPTCEACGEGADAELEVHHVVPYHMDPSKELCPDNLITLCNKHEHHILFGHLQDFKSFNKTVREDAATWLKKIKNRP